MNRWGRRLAVAIIPAAVAGMLAFPSPVLGQTPPPTGGAPGVGIEPVGTNPTNDPNGGQWFVAQGAPGDKVVLKARVVNPGTAATTVKLYTADLNFSDDGTPQIAPQSSDIGTWGVFNPPTITLEPRENRTVEFAVVIPEGAEPGDHVGVVVVENQPQTSGDGNIFKVVKRVSTRLYVTVPGDARPSFGITDVSVTPDSTFFAREATVRVTLRNTGRVRLIPTVTVNGVKAAGPDLLLTRSIESYVATMKVPLWGGPQSYRVDVQTRLAVRGGPAEQKRVSRFYVPWLLIAVLLGAILLVFLVRLLWRRRGSKYAAIRTDMRRIERLLQEQRAGGAARLDDDDEVDAGAAIKAAMKRAARAGEDEAVAKLEAKLDEHEAAIAPPVVSDRAELPAPAEPAPQAPPPPAVVHAPAPAPPPAPPVVEVPQAAPPSTPVFETSPAPANGLGRSDDHLLTDDDPERRRQIERAREIATRRQAERAAAAAAERAANGDGDGDASDPAAGDHVALGAMLRQIAQLPDGLQRKALISAAQTFGPSALGAHDDLLEDLPIEVRLALLRGAFSQSSEGGPPA